MEKMEKAKAKLAHSDVARRLIAVRDELGVKNAPLAEMLGVPRTRFLHWISASKSANFPAEEAMIMLCDLLPGLTMDFIYRGKIDAIPYALAIRLQARMQGRNPDET